MDLESDYYSSRCKDINGVFECLKGDDFHDVCGVGGVIIQRYILF
jgi:hypothetical protein